MTLISTLSVGLAVMLAQINAPPRPPATAAPVPASQSAQTSSLSLTVTRLGRVPPEPIKGAQIELRRTVEARLPGYARVCGPDHELSNPEPYRRVITGANGSYTFGNIEAGDYVVSVEREGYVREENPITLAKGQLINRTIQMNAAPAITGRVVDPLGQPVTAASVQAYQVRFTPYGRTLRTAKAALSDDNGEYRLFWLEPGLYYVAASANAHVLEPWTSVMRLTPNLANPDDGFPRAFYPSVLSPGDALIIALPAGSSVVADVTLKETPRFNVRARLVSGGSAPKTPHVYFVPPGGDLCAPPDFGMTQNDDGTVDLKGVAQGSYVLFVMDGARSISTVVPVEVNRDIDDLSIQLYPSVNITGAFRMDDVNPGASLKDAHVDLIRSGLEISQRAGGRADAAGAFTIPGLAPGIYDVSVYGLPAGVYVRSILADDRELLNVQAETPAIEIKAGDPPPKLEILLSPAQGRFLSQVCVGVNRYMPVLLVPDSPERPWPDRYVIGAAPPVPPGGRSSYSRDDVPPGDYVAYAFEGIEPDLLYDAQLRSRFSDRGRHVRISERGTEGCPSCDAFDSSVCGLNLIHADEIGLGQ